MIVLSARGFEQAKVDALEAGADDYLTKPFGAAELLCAHEGCPTPCAARRCASWRVFENDGLKVDRGNVWWQWMIKRCISHPRIKLLHVLVQNAGKVVTHGQLLKEVLG